MRVMLTPASDLREVFKTLVDPHDAESSHDRTWYPPIPQNLWPTDSANLQRLYRHAEILFPFLEATHPNCCSRFKSA